MNLPRPSKKSGLISKNSPTFVPENVSGKDVSAAVARMPRMDFSEPDTSDANKNKISISIVPNHLDLASSKKEVIKIKLDFLVDSPYQPRLQYSDSKLSELAESLRSRQIDPLSVRRVNDGFFEIISGHRRKRAAPLADLDELECIVIEANDSDARIFVMAANEAREDFTDYERALAYANALEDGKKGAGTVKTQKQLADRLGISEQLLSRRMKMLKLPKHVTTVLQEYPNAFSSHWTDKLLQLTSQAHDEDKLCKELIRVAKNEMQMSAIFSVMAAAKASNSSIGSTRQGLSLQRDNQLFAQITPNIDKRQVMVKLPGSCDIDQVAALILNAIDQHFTLANS